jgi:hypothetical protein
MPFAGVGYAVVVTDPQAAKVALRSDMLVPLSLPALSVHRSADGPSAWVGLG